MPVDVEPYLHRCACGACGAVLWTDKPQRVVCVCSASTLEADGSLSGAAVDTDDDEMCAYLGAVYGRPGVVVEKVI